MKQGKAEIAQILGEESIVVSCSLEQAILGVLKLATVVQNREEYNHIFQTLLTLDKQLNNLQDLELTLLFNPILQLPDRS